MIKFFVSLEQEELLFEIPHQYQGKPNRKDIIVAQGYSIYVVAQGNLAERMDLEECLQLGFE